MMARKDAPSIFERLQMFMEDEKEAGKLITYGIASVSLFAALYKIRPFAKFTKPSDVPLHFLQSRVPLQGVSWLQTVLNEKLVTFVPVVKEKEYLECVVAMPQKDQDSLEIGEELVKLGLATVHEPWIKLKDKQVLAYKKSLANAQKWAVRRRNGYWHFVKQPTVLWRTEMFMIDKMKSLLPTIVVKWLDL
ncbi:PREDICTED: uncharacterized protein LOC108686672 isoform X2 [Atta colombica]|uniref:uncharacterized protein LOC108686672 isoform X2 n=1 Tax=Atta colombica TaxID=520822 RepID=UPI00084BC540|nr:PREDICTED: uncharacterized protein LOC108686672 isoform X2 [Atta colombica]